MSTINQDLFRVLGSKMLFFIASFCLFLFLLLNVKSSQINYYLVLQSVLIGCIAIYQISYAHSGLLGQVVGVFFLIAFSCFPILEIFTNTTYWGGSNLDSIYLAVANLCVIVFLMVFVIGYRLRIRIPTFVDTLIFPSSLSLWQQTILLGIEIVCLVFIIGLYNWDFLTLFFRGGENHVELDVELKSTLLLVEFFLRPLVLNMGLYIYFSSRGKSIISVIALLLGVCAVFPTGVPRFLATAMYMPFILHWAFAQANDQKSTLHFPRLFLPNILIFGLFFVFPILDIFRTYSSGDNIGFNAFGLDTMLAGHFDGFQMLVRALDVGDITYGYGFFGSILFFVPRSIWPSKPIGSAQEVAHISNLSFDNVSMTLVGEFYLNFWYFGIVFGALIFAIVIRSIDIKFLKKNEYVISAHWILYFQSTGLLLFVLRGSFLSAFAYSVAVAMTWLMIGLVGRLVARM